LKIEIADNFSSRQKGLMYRKNLDSDSGMLFIFNSPDILSFWGKNTYIPLDIAFIDDNKKIISIKEIIPLDTRSVRCESPCKYALETNYGYLKSIGVGEGDYIEIKNNNLDFIKK
jgi:uncharacterized protein